MWLEYENSNTQLSDFNDDDEDFKLKNFFCGIIPQNQYDNNMIIAFTSAAYCIFFPAALLRSFLMHSPVSCFCYRYKKTASASGSLKSKAVPNTAGVFP